MIEIAFSHWPIYVYLLSVLVIVSVNLWLSARDREEGS